MGKYVYVLRRMLKNLLLKQKQPTGANRIIYSLGSNMVPSPAGSAGQLLAELQYTDVFSKPFGKNFKHSININIPITIQNSSEGFSGVFRIRMPLP
jgi:hypothetical protein